MKKIQITAFIERENQEKAVELTKETVGALLNTLEINPVTVIVVRNNEVCTEDETLHDNDAVKIISVISGG